MEHPSSEISGKYSSIWGVTGMGAQECSSTL